MAQRKRLSGFFSHLLGKVRSCAPSREPEQPKRTTASGIAAGRPPARILVVDDEPKVAQGLKRMLFRHQVTLAYSGEQALHLLRTQDYDVILSDVMMPALSGIDVYTLLQAEQSPLVDRFIFISGGGHSEQARMFLKAVPNLRFDKPVDPDVLELAIAQMQQDRDEALDGAG